VEEMTMTVQEARAALGRRVDAAHYSGDITKITKNGELRAVLVPAAVLRWYLEQQNRPV
jgi:antitoxin (DNA-binding transcriptional repressor) of toxin-antitoxin stability system